MIIAVLRGSEKTMRIGSRRAAARRVDWDKLAYQREDRNASSYDLPRLRAALRGAVGARRSADPGAARTRPARRTAAAPTRRDHRRSAFERPFPYPAAGPRRR